jgi:hypothetical protein
MSHIKRSLATLDRAVGQRLSDVHHRTFAPPDAERVGVVAIQLSFEKQQLYVSVDCDDDTIVVADFAPPISLHEADVSARHLPHWQPNHAKRLEFAWLCINHKGYVDGVQFGFAHYHPTISIVAVGSALQTYCIYRASD